jgi:hypothetical protein
MSKRCGGEATLLERFTACQSQAETDPNAGTMHDSPSFSGAPQRGSIPLQPSIGPVRSGRCLCVPHCAGGRFHLDFGSDRIQI